MTELIDEEGTSWLLETKAQETEESETQRSCSHLWCENACTLTGKAWRYLKVPQKEFEKLQSESLAELTVLGAK